MRIKSRCGVSFDEFSPHKTCIYAVGKPPFWKMPELRECPYLRLHYNTSDRKTWGM